jgi:hypothetical protein
MALIIALLWSHRGGRFLMSEVTLYYQRGMYAAQRSVRWEQSFEINIITTQKEERLDRDL